MKKPVIVLTGPTAVGKTELSLMLAKAVDGEIVSCDSMQVYRGMDIGSAKIRQEERKGIPHHLLDICEPDEEFNVVRFQTEAKKAMEGIWERGHIPVLTGGTGFYIQSVLYDIDFQSTSADDGIREKLERQAREEGPESVYALLKKLDPESAEAIHPNNVKRVIRAVEYAMQTGQKISEHNEEERRRSSPYTFAYFVLNRPRPELYSRIDARVDLMMQEGLVREVEALKERGLKRGMVSMQGLGYKEILSFLEGEISLEEAVRIIKQETRHFAKRQITWFKREKDVIWIELENYSSEEEALSYMLEIWNQKNIQE